MGSFDIKAGSGYLSTTAGIVMKANSSLWTPNTGNNTSGFTALPNGGRDANFWSATKHATIYANTLTLNYFSENVQYGPTIKSNGLSVRCIVTPPPPPPPPCGTSTITDIDGNIYNTVLIGEQCWTKENLRVRKYNDGTDIRFDTSGGTLGNVNQTWAGTGLNYGAYTLYAHDSTTTPSSNLSNYGYLYNWYAVGDSRGLCPPGWGVPKMVDWEDLDTYLGGEPTSGFKMRSVGTVYWDIPNTLATNESGFSALPGGGRFGSDGRFRAIRNDAFFWSIDEYTHTPPFNFAWSRRMDTRIGSAYIVNPFSPERKSDGKSVRCIRD